MTCSSPSDDPQPKGLAQREFTFSDHDFERIRTLIRDHAGIALAPHKKDMVYSRLARRLRATDTRSFRDYLARLEGGDTREFEAFVNALTTNLTSFFREAHHFRILAEHLLNHKSQDTLSIWCGACSTGEEAYSIAMTALETLGSTTRVKILASDLDTNVLAIARQGLYPLQRLEKLPPEKVRRFFVADPQTPPGQLRAGPDLQKMITFQQINLCAAHWPVRGPIDAIFCRNVMIYLDKQTQRQILSKFSPLLRPDGLLFAGHSESFHHSTDLFKLLGRTVYQLAPGQKGTGLSTPRPRP
ncbi:MAG: chemotaxis protein CheR [Betaproteobacteria bacterium]|nr:chemotaxis protein CheR [Betaproteobacteria bacterium]